MTSFENLRKFVALGAESESDQPEILLAAVQRNLITESELLECLDEQAKARTTGRILSLEEILQRRGLLRGELAGLIRGSLPPATGGPAIPRFEIREVIGEGATSIVYRAWDRHLDRIVALKVLRNPEISEVRRRRFLREAQTAAKLAHPNLVTVHDAAEHEGHLYLVMEFIAGQPFNRVLSEGRLPMPAILEILAKVSRAVGEAHSHGIVHRDLKPANIFVGDSGEPKVGDFGLALTTASDTALTKSGVTVGTPLYMSPEQAAGESELVSQRSDVYALGVILYEALTRRAPHTGSHVLEILSKILNVDPVPPRRLNPKVPFEVEAICLKALDKEPGRRYANGNELADDLEAHLRGDPIQASRSTFVARQWRRAKRHPRILILTCLTAAAAAAGLLFGWALLRKSETVKLMERDHQYSDAYFNLRIRTQDAMRALEDSWHGAPATAGTTTLLGQIESVTRDVAAANPQAKSPRAWHGLALVFAGRDEEGLKEIEATCAEPSEDPFPLMFLAHAHLAEYARSMPSLHVDATEQNLVIPAPVISDRLKGLARRAVEALDLARAKRKSLETFTQGREYLVFAEGARRLNQQDYEEANRKFRDLKAEPLLSGSATLLAGLTALHLRRFDEAAELWESVGARRWPRGYVNAGMARFSSALTDLLGPADPEPHLDQALTDFEAAGRISSFSGLVSLSKGRILFLKGRAAAKKGQVPRPPLLAAVECFKLAQEWASYAPDAAFEAGTVFEVLGREELKRGGDPRPDWLRAIDSFGRVPQTSPVTSRSRLERGCTNLEIVRFGDATDPIPSLEAAAADFEAAAQNSDPAIRASALRYRGATAHIRTRFESGPKVIAGCREAISWLDKAVDADPNDLEARMNRGSAHGALSSLPIGKAETHAEHELALRDFTEILQRSPDHRKALLGRAQIYAVMAADPALSASILPLAIADTTRLIGMEAPWEAYRLRGRIYGHQVEEGLASTEDRKANYRKAMDDLTESLKLKPDQPDLQALLERLHRKYGGDQ